VKQKRWVMMHPAGLVSFSAVWEQGSSPNSESSPSIKTRSFKGKSWLKYTDPSKSTGQRSSSQIIACIYIFIKFTTTVC